MIPKNKKGKKFSWSPSAISDFITCPMQYGARRFYETLPYVETEEMKAGTVEHKHLEDRLKLKKPLPEGFTRGEKYCLALEKATYDGQLQLELELAIDRDMKFVKWLDKNAYGRCKIDVLAIVWPTATIVDWKTGRIKEDSLQLKINSCFVSLLHPAITKFNNRYVWLKHDTPTGEVFTKDQIPQLWDELFGWIHRMENAWQTETFEPRPSGLCRNWCNVTNCRYCGKGR